MVEQAEPCTQERQAGDARRLHPEHACTEMSEDKAVVAKQGALAG